MEDVGKTLITIKSDGQASLISINIVRSLFSTRTQAIFAPIMKISFPTLSRFQQGTGPTSRLTETLVDGLSALFL